MAKLSYFYFCFLVYAINLRYNEYTKEGERRDKKRYKKL